MKKTTMEEKNDHNQNYKAEIKTYGMAAQGRSELLKHLSGERLTRNQAILAKCYDCEGHYADGKHACVIPECPLYPYNAYVRKESESE